MKKLIVTIAAVLAFMPAFAQTDAQKAAEEAASAIAGAPKAEAPVVKPNYWKKSMMTQLNFVQSSFSNWAKGGINNVTLSAYVDANADYSKDNIHWKNRLQLDYGFMYSEDKPIVQKNKDRMLFESTWGMKATKTLDYSATFTFLNQFNNGYLYGTPSVENPSKADWKAARTLKSGFFSPAIVTLGLGIDWKPNENGWLVVNFAPLTGGFTIVSDEVLRSNYGMKLKKAYENVEGTPEGSWYRPARFEFGAQLKAVAKVKVNDNFEGSTQLILFSNYLDHPGNLRINWDNRLMWKLAKYFSLNITTNLIYDDTVRIVDEDHPAGRRLVQFSEALQFGFTYTFASK